MILQILDVVLLPVVVLVVGCLIIKRMKQPTRLHNDIYDHDSRGKS